MAVRGDSLSVLVIDEEPAVLAFIARILDSHGVRALLARSVPEAIGIARRGYVPIDLVLTDLLLTDLSHMQFTGAEVVDRIRELRPDVRVLFMSAQIEAGVIRLRVMTPGIETPLQILDDPKLDDQGLIESIQRVAYAPLVRRSSSAATH